MEILFININNINENNILWNYYFNLFSQSEREKIANFKDNDKKVCFTSLLLQHHVIQYNFNVDFGSIKIKKNAYGKPYVDNFEYNISHHKDIVIIITDPKCCVGIDIMCMNQTVDIETFKFIFTENEYKQIKNNLDFFILWCLKESYIKGIGKGLYVELSSIEFNIEDKNKIILFLDGVIVTDWYFNIYLLQYEYIIAVAQQTTNE